MLKLLPQSDSTSVEFIEAYIDSSEFSASTWLMVPKECEKTKEDAKSISFDLGNSYIGLMPFGKWFWIDLNQEKLKKIKKIDTKKVLEKYKILVVTGLKSGYALEVFEKDNFKNFDEFNTNFNKKTLLNTSQIEKKLTISYRNFNRDILKMKYSSSGLKADAWINNSKVDYENWNAGKVYESQYLTLKDGLMRLSDGYKSFNIDFNAFKVE